MALTTAATPTTLKNATISDDSAGPYKHMFVPLKSVCPGVVDPQATISVILQPHHTKLPGVRDVTEAMKIEVGKRDGVIPPSASYAQARALLSSFEIDHYIPLIWGGSNDMKNLWAQPIGEARKKDVVEVHGRMYLKAMSTQAALSSLQSAVTAPGGSWINAANTVIDPFLSSHATEVTTMLDAEAKSLVGEHNYKLAAVAYRELASAHASIRSSSGTSALDVRPTDTTTRYTALAKQYETLAAKKAGDD